MPLLTFVHFLKRDIIFLWRSREQNVLSFGRNSCKTMWWANTFWCIELLLSSHVCKQQWIPPLWVFSPPAFGGCYWKPWLPALIVYFVLPFFVWRPSHDSAVGVADKAGRRFHRSSAYCQDDRWVTQRIIIEFVKQRQCIYTVTQCFGFYHE